MTIQEALARAFQEAGIPGFEQEWRATPDYPQIPKTYGVYLIAVKTPEISADDAPLFLRRNVIVELFSTTDLDEAAARMERILWDGGFYIPRVRDLNDVRAGEYQYHMRFELYAYEADGIMI